MQQLYFHLSGMFATWLFVCRNPGNSTGFRLHFLDKIPIAGKLSGHSTRKAERDEATIGKGRANFSKNSRLKLRATNFGRVRAEYERLYRNPHSDCLRISALCVNGPLVSRSVSYVQWPCDVTMSVTSQPLAVALTPQILTAFRWFSLFGLDWILNSDKSMLIMNWNWENKLIPYDVIMKIFVPRQYWVISHCL